MNDDIITRPQLVVPDPNARILSPRDAKRLADDQRKYDEAGNRKIPPADSMSAPISRDEAMRHLATAVHAASDKMYEQMSGELGDRLEAMEAVIMENVLRRIHRRTWRYRFAMWARGWLTELGVLDPVQRARVVDPVEALDPNVHQDGGAIGSSNWAAHPERRLVVREVAVYNAETQAFLENDGGVALLRHPEDGKWYLVAASGGPLRRAAAAIGYATENIDDEMTALQLLDLDSLKRARGLVQSDG